MIPSREAVYGQLFNILQTLAASCNPGAVASLAAVGITPLPVISAPPIKFASRREAVLGELPIEQYPALMLIEKGEINERTLTYGPSRTTFVTHVIIQTATGQNTDDVPAVEMNNLADAIEDVIETSAGQYPPGTNQLRVPVGEVGSPEPGGMVFLCQVNGRETMTLALKESVYSMAIIEVDIIVP